MPIVNGMNSDYVEYFSLEDYIKKIKLLPYVIEHMEDVNNVFDQYMKKLSNYPSEYIVNYWIYLLYEELEYNQEIESHKLDARALIGKNLYFDTLNLNHKRIHELRNFAKSDSIITDYRDSEVRVSREYPDGHEDIFWRGAQAKDVHKFMNDFIKVYKHNGTSLLYSNPFLVSSLMHLLFVRIHPYGDGNGRTARIIHNIKFTDTLNKIKGTRLKLSPINLSHSILLNKGTYVNRINDIYFDDKHDTNDSINKWFDFVLDMYDEQIHYSNNKLDNEDLQGMSYDENSKKLNHMRLSRLKK